MGRLTNGLLAGAAGTAALNAVTYADMAILARAASSTPQDTVSRLAGMKLGDDDAAQHHRDGLGALFGYSTGVTVGVLASVAGGPSGAGPRRRRDDGLDLPMAALGVTDPRTWQGRGRPRGTHLAYGMVTAWALRRLRRPQRNR